MGEAAQRVNNRGGPLLDAAARLFASKGYRETTIRDIAKATGMLPGSVYYHFSSKHDLLVACIDEGVRRVGELVDAALERETEPWARLEAAVRAHLDSVLDQSDYARVMIRVVPEQVPEVAAELTRLRDEYEARFVGLIDALPLPRHVDRKMLRLMVFGSVNWAQVWYRPGGATPAEIAHAFIQFLRQPMQPGGSS